MSLLSQRSSLTYLILAELPGNSAELHPIREPLQNGFHLAVLLAEDVANVYGARGLELVRFAIALRSGLR